MSEFLIFLQLGFTHITDWQGYDHMLFILALCAVYQPKDWRQILWLVTAFTIGHSLTLALAVLNIVSVASDVVEFLIPVTIFITALLNLVGGGRLEGRRRYALAAGFGLIHGLGFSNYLRSLLGRDTSIVRQLFAFNIGLEIGQLLVVALLMLLAAFAVKLLRVPPRMWQTGLSVLALAVAGFLAVEKWPF